MGWPQIDLVVARLHYLKIVRYPKKFDLFHQTVSPRERVGFGDEVSGLCSDSLMLFTYYRGVSKCWNGIWNVTMEWTMEWTIKIRKCCFIG